MVTKFHTSCLILYANIIVYRKQHEVKKKQLVGLIIIKVKHSCLPIPHKKKIIGVGDLGLEPKAMLGNRGRGSIQKTENWGTSLWMVHNMYHVVVFSIHFQLCKRKLLVYVGEGAHAMRPINAYLYRILDLLVNFQDPFGSGLWS